MSIDFTSRTQHNAHRAYAGMWDAVVLVDTLDVPALSALRDQVTIEALRAPDEEGLEIAASNALLRAYVLYLDACIAERLVVVADRPGA